MKYLKKSHGHTEQRLTVAKYIAVKQTKSKDTSISVNSVLKKLGVSKSGYYKWLKRNPSKQQLRKEELKEKIKEIHENSYNIYGSPKISEILKQTGEVISQRTVHQCMKELGIQAHYIKPWIKTTVNGDYSSKLENILNRQFNPSKPNAVWCTDITYIWTKEGFVYLTSIMDLYSRKIIAWTLSESMEAETVLQCLQRAIKENPSVEARVIQSDRGAQFVSEIYKKICGNMTRSYSDKGVPYDNACIESFHSLIKREWLNRHKIENYNHAYILIFEYIEAFYNTVRIHSHCEYKSPNEYINMYYRKLN
ncbi:MULTISPECIES: IS3 family transposase [unclassified Breznakia]|uniref:IS3 family transposase n=1 Tax=unclassified Breznakia TaxID=2623764 RepID=UPI002406333A|nr:MULTISPECIES: IS3 family transposase [unclassified Breznakia]